MGLNAGKKTVAVFTPFLSGFYLGNICEAFRQQAAQRDLDLMIIMTNGFGEYDLPVGLDYIDAAYFALSAVSKDFAETLIKKNIPILTNVEGYGSLAVEAVVSDQRSGIQKAFYHLYHLGHRRIGFVGDMSIYDFKVRFEALKDCYREVDLHFDRRWLLDVDEPTMHGGVQAGTEFLKQSQQGYGDNNCSDNTCSDNNCTAYICGADLIAIGFEKTISKKGWQVPKDMALVGIDNTNLGKTLPYTLTSVDQNIDTMVKMALDRIEARLRGEPFVRQTVLVEQRLDVGESCGMNTASIQSLIDEKKKYAEKIFDDIQKMQDGHESAMALAGLGFDWVINLSRLWGPFLKWTCMGHWVRNENETLDDFVSYRPPKASDHIKISSIYSEDNDDTSVRENVEANIGKRSVASSFPSRNLEGCPLPQHALVTLLPISPEGAHWGMMAIVDELRNDMDNAGYHMFNYYLVLMSFFVQRDALTDSMKAKERSASELAKQLCAISKTSNDGILLWNFENNLVEWNPRLLHMLGFTSDEEIKIYQHMSMLERVHQKDKDSVRDLLMEHIDHNEPFQTEYRLKSKHGHYLWVEAKGMSIRDSHGRVERFICAYTDLTEQHQSKKCIEFMSMHDVLTGLPNRLALTEKIDLFIHKNPQQTFGVVLIDLNRFKMINDSFGHQVGDSVLKYVAEKTRLLMRKHDVLSRWGGDEFVLMCEVTSGQEALSFSKRILEGINGIFISDKTEIPVNISMGISLYPQDGSSAEDLIKKANTAMYKMKRWRLDRACLYSDEMEASYKEVIDMENRLRQAFLAKEFFLVIQPLVNPSHHVIEGGEVLCRWNSAKYGLVPPSKFIQLAEDIGFINKIGAWVLKEALQCLAEWKKKGMHPLKLSINVSPHQLFDPSFSEYIKDMLLEYAIDPTVIYLEITETAAIEDMFNTVKSLNVLREVGVNVSLDDFGTGYSSLNLLNELPLDWVKVDRSFIKDIDVDEKKKDMVLYIVSLCHSLGYQVVAEGVETPEQLQLVTTFGCEQVQGFVYSKPIPMSEFEDLWFKGSLLPHKEMDSSTGKSDAG